MQERYSATLGKSDLPYDEWMKEQGYVLKELTKATLMEEEDDCKVMQSDDTTGGVLL